MRHSVAVVPTVMWLHPMRSGRAPGVGEFDHKGAGAADESESAVECGDGSNGVGAPSVFHKGTPFAAQGSFVTQNVHFLDFPNRTEKLMDVVHGGRAGNHSNEKFVFLLTVRGFNLHGAAHAS